MFRSSKLSEALSIAKQAIALFPTDPTVNLTLAVALIASDKHAEAVPHFEIWLTTHPSDAVNLRMMGEAQRNAGSLSSAHETLDKAFKLNPEDAYIRVAMVKTLLKSGDRQKAI